MKEIDFSELHKEVVSMGAEPVHTPFKRTNYIKAVERQKVCDDFGDDGEKELEPNDFDSIESIDGHLVLGRTPVTLYIKDPSDLWGEPHNPRVHLMACEKVLEMKEAGRYNRYVVSIRDGGEFTVRRKSRITRKLIDREEKLLPCQYCLSEIKPAGFNTCRSWADKKRFAKKFDFKRFFLEYEYVFRELPLYTELTSPKECAHAEWRKISFDVREAANWICSCCKVDCSNGEARRFLHCHHSDGVQGNRRPSNLVSLCILCHSNKPCHGHMTIKPDETEVIKDLRRRQKLPARCEKCHS